MRTFIACAGIDGSEAALNTLLELVADYGPDGVLFAGGVYSPPRAGEFPSEAADRQREGVRLLEKFFSAMREQDRLVAVIPGPHDAPLRFFLHAATAADTWGASPRVVHLATVEAHHLAVAGVGGELTRSDDSGETTVRSSRVTADYFLRGFAGSPQSHKVLLLGAAPRGELGGPEAHEEPNELIDTLHPALCVVGGPTANRGHQRVAHTLVVNPGRLVDRSAAWIDWGRDAANHVEMVTAASAALA